MSAEKLFNDGGPLSDRILNFFTKKTLQLSYNFLVYFDESDQSLFGNLGAFHCAGVELPSYSFKKEYIYYGPFVKSFPVLDHNGFEFTLKFEEDENSTVRSLIQKLTRKQINADGYYNTYDKTVIDQMVISVYSHDAFNSFKIYMKNCFFMKASTVNYAYDSNDKITFDITFNCDHYVVVPHIAVDKEIRDEKETRFDTNSYDTLRSNVAKKRKQ